MITIKQLEALRQVASLGNISRAAGRLFTTESALSKRIQDLEQAIGTDLFDRSDRTLRLNDVGREAVRLADELIDIRDSLLNLVSRQGIAEKTLRFGMTDLVSHLSLPLLVKDFAANFPHVRVEPKVGMTFDLLKDLDNGELDLLIIPYPNFQPQLKCTELFQVRSAWVCSPDLSRPPGGLDPGQLAAMPLILQSSPSALSVHARQWFSCHQLETPRLMTCNSLEAVRNLAAAGFGAALLPQVFCMRQVREGTLVELNVQPELSALTYGAVIRSDSADQVFLDAMARRIAETLVTRHYCGEVGYV